MTRPTETDTGVDTDAAEDFADEVGVDPTQDEIARYRRMEGQETDDRRDLLDAPRED
jgi:hypothetical protein